jgi:hypothetical protein
MESDWDSVLHCISELNRSRVLSEVGTVNAVNTILEALERCKISLCNNSRTSSDALAQLVLESDNSELISRKRDETVHNAVTQLKQVVVSCLKQEDEEDDLLGITESSKEELDLVDFSLASHFLHEGYLETAKVFSEETHIQYYPESDYVRTKTGIEATREMVKRGYLEPAIAWLEENSSNGSSNLLFDLHRLRFLQLAASQTEAIGYAQRNFAPFASTRAQEIQTLLGGLLFQPPTTTNPTRTSSSSSPPSLVSRLNEDKGWDQARIGILKEINRTFSSMSILIATGGKAINDFKLYQKLVAPSARLTTKSWTELTELPIQVHPLVHFHSEFWCPVSQEKTDSENNPPMLLQCGHVVAKNSILRIAKGRARFKCPTCPTEQAVDSATPIYF